MEGRSGKEGIFEGLVLVGSQGVDGGWHGEGKEPT